MKTFIHNNFEHKIHYYKVNNKKLTFKSINNHKTHHYIICTIEQCFLVIIIYNNIMINNKLWSVI
jgi:hypothetical protein